jgi:hypothetical protein
MGTDKTDPLKPKPKSPSYPCWSCYPWSKFFKIQFVHFRHALLMEKISFHRHEEEIEPRSTPTDESQNDYKKSFPLVGMRGVAMC